MFNPFDPQPDQGTSQQAGILSDPRTLGALLSTGLALMQPPSFGDTGASQIGRAIGAGAQSITTGEEQRRKDQELESKQDLRSAQADAAAARAGTAESRSSAAADRLAYQRQALSDLNERNRLGLSVRLSGLYQNYLHDVANRNLKNKQQADVMGTAFTPEPSLPFNDWKAQNPLLKNLGVTEGDMSGAGLGGGTTPPRGQVDPGQALNDAKDAIARGAPRAAVAQKYKALTGQDLPNF